MRRIGFEPCDIDGNEKVHVGCAGKTLQVLMCLMRTSIWTAEAAIDDAPEEAYFVSYEGKFWNGMDVNGFRLIETWGGSQSEFSYSLGAL